MSKKVNKYPTIKLSVTILFNIYVVSWWLEVGKRVPLLGEIRFEFIFASILGVIALKTYFTSKKESNNKDLATIIIVYLLVMLISQPLAYNFQLSWNTYIDHVLKYSVMSFFISQFVVSPTTFRIFSFSTLLAFLKIGQEALWGKVSGNMVWQNQGIQRLHGTQGTMFGHPNELSGKALSLLPFLLYGLGFLKNKWIRLLILVQVAFTINIMIFTGSRTGYVGAIFMLIFMYYISNKKLKGLFVLVVIASISINFIPNEYKGRFLSIFSGEDKEGSSTDARKNLFFDSLDVFINNPLGVGLFCFPEVQRVAGRNPQETHNLYTQILSETGIQGALLFAVFIYVLLRKIRQARKGFQTCMSSLLMSREKYPSLSYSNTFQEEVSSCQFLLFLSNGLLVFLITRLVLGLFGHDLLEIYWWIAAGMAMSLTNILRKMEAIVLEIPKELLKK